MSLPSCSYLYKKFWDLVITPPRPMKKEAIIISYKTYLRKHKIKIRQICLLYRHFVRLKTKGVNDVLLCIRNRLKVNRTWCDQYFYTLQTPIWKCSSPLFKEPGKIQKLKPPQFKCFTFFRPDGVGTVTHEEKERFQVIKERLRVLLEHQITNFR